MARDTQPVELTGSNATDSQSGLVPGMGFNGATYDRWRNNTEGVLLASAARTTTPTSATQTNHNARGVIVHLYVTANPGGAEKLDLVIRTKDPSSTASFWYVPFSSAITAINGYRQIILYPGITEFTDSSSLAKSKPLPRNWDVTVNHSGSGSWTYSVGYSLIM